MPGTSSIPYLLPEIGSILPYKDEINDFLDDYYDRYTGLYLKSKKFLKTLESLWYNIKDVYFKCCKDGDGILSAV